MPYQKVLVFCDRGSWARCWNAPTHPPPPAPDFLLLTACRQASSQASETPLRKQEFANPFQAGSDFHGMGALFLPLTATTCRAPETHLCTPGFPPSTVETPLG